MQLHLIPALASLAAFISFTNGARASATQLNYAAPEGCPGSDDFLKALETRGVSAQLAAAPRVIAVSISPTPTGYTGRLQVQDEQGTTQAREASGSTCAEVADAMAAVGALILAPAEAEAGTGAEPSAAVPAAKAAAPTPTPEKDSVVPKDNAPDVFRAASRMGSDARHWKQEVEAGTVHYDLNNLVTINSSATLGLLPGALVPRLELTGLTAPFLTLPGGEQTLVGVMPRIRVGLILPVSTQIDEQQVKLTGFDLQLGLCFSPHYDSTGWVLSACAEYGGSLLGLDIGSGEEQRTEAHGYANVGLDFTAQYHFTPWFHASLRVGSQAYIGRDKVSLGEGRGDFELGTPATLSGAAGLGFSF